MNGATPMRDVLEELLVERYGPSPHPEPDSPEVIRERQRLLASMPGDEVPEEVDER